MKQVVIFFKSGNVMTLDVKGEVEWSHKSGSLTKFNADDLDCYGAYIDPREVEAFKIVKVPLFGSPKGAV